MNLKLLYLGINRSYVNPTFDNLLISLSQNNVLYRYGPGFVTDSELEKGIDFWLDKHEEFDFVLTDSMILECDDLIKNPYLFENEAIFFKKSTYKTYAPKIKEYFLSLKKNKIFIANWDYYERQPRHVDLLIKDEFVYVISHVDKNTSYNVEKINKLGNLMIPDVLSEYPQRSNVWHNFISDYAFKIISMPNTVNERNFVFTPVEGRKYRFCVPGFPYRERQTARKLYNLRERFFHEWAELKFLFEKISRKLFIPRPKNWSQIQTNRLFSRLSNSKMVFTSGAVTRTPIAKYFEIPASGSVLICQKFAGFEHLGFQNGVNCLVAEDLQTLNKILANYDVNRYQQLADNGRSFIWDKHTIHSRTVQLELCLTSIKSGNFNGSHWDQGEFIIL